MWGVGGWGGVNPPSPLNSRGRAGSSSAARPAACPGAATPERLPEPGGRDPARSPCAAPAARGGPHSAVDGRRLFARSAPSRAASVCAGTAFRAGRERPDSPGPARFPAAGRTPGAERRAGLVESSEPRRPKRIRPGRGLADTGEPGPARAPNERVGRAQGARRAQPLPVHTAQGPIRAPEGRPGSISTLI